MEFTELYAKLLVQRVEATFRRDLTLSFALWHMVFRTKVNLGRHFYAAMREAACYAGDEEHKYTYDDMLNAANEVLTGLAGEYRTSEYTTVKVRGNLALLRGNLVTDDSTQPHDGVGPDQAHRRGFARLGQTRCAVDRDVV